MNKLFVALMLIAPVAQAGSVDALCNLQKAKSEVIAAIAGSPEVLVSNNPVAIGLSPGGSSNSAGISNMGTSVVIKQSLSGLEKARKLRSSADASCKAIASAQVLSDFLDAYVENIDGMAAKKSMPHLNNAIDQIKQQLIEIKPKLASNNATVQDYAFLTSQLTDLQIKRQVALIAINKSPDDYSVQKLQSNMDLFLEHSSEAQALEASAYGTHAWDVSVGVGKNGSNGSTTAMLTAKISLGAYGAYSAVDDVRVSARAALLDQRDSLVSKVTKAKKQLENNLLGESLVIDATNLQIRQHEQTLADISKVQTQVASDVSSKLRIALAIAKSQLIYSLERQRLSKEALSSFLN